MALSVMRDMNSSAVGHTPVISTVRYRRFDFLPLLPTVTESRGRVRERSWKGKGLCDTLCGELYSTRMLRIRYITLENP